MHKSFSSLITPVILSYICVEIGELLLVIINFVLFHRVLKGLFVRFWGLAVSQYPPLLNH